MDNMNNTDERDMQNVNTDETAAPEEDNALVAEEAAAPKDGCRSRRSCFTA